MLFQDKSGQYMLNQFRSGKFTLVQVRTDLVRLGLIMSS